SLISVVFPAPFGPTSAAVVPSPTRNDASSISARPSGSAWLICATSTCPTSVPSPYRRAASPAPAHFPPHLTHSRHRRHRINPIAKDGEGAEWCSLAGRRWQPH